MSAQSWVDLAQDEDTGIETIRAHFRGHAYDPPVSYTHLTLPTILLV